MNQPFAIGDIVETIKGARFWGEVVSCYPVTAPTPDLAWRCDVRAVDPGFEGTIHVYPATQLAAIGAKPSLRASADVLAERRRQVEVEGWTPQHDDAHRGGSLATAAACYAAHSQMPTEIRSHGNRDHGRVPFLWPRSWSYTWFKPTDRRRDLVKAGALILADIERIDRQLAGQIVGTRAGIIVGDEHSESAHAAEFPAPAAEWDPQP